LFQVKNIFYCHVCNSLHKRIETNRLVESARYCSLCNSFHAVNENDIWSEKIGFWNKKINFYAYMENKVFDISELIRCRLNEVDFIIQNNHNITGKLIREYSTNWTEKNDNENHDELKTNKYIQIFECFFLNILLIILFTKASL